MHIFGLPQYKYVYPTLMLVGLFIFLMMRYASGGEIAPPFHRGDITPPYRHQDARHGMDVFKNNENEYIDAADRFNRGIGRDDLLENRIQRQADRLRDLEGGFRRSSPGYYNQETAERLDREYRNDLYIDNDSRYSMERRQLDNMRSRELTQYREQRRELQNSMTGYNKDSEEYERLERQLNALDRRHAEEERRFEREFRNMDANYSLTR